MASHIPVMLKFAPIALAILYALIMYKFSAWKTSAELNANSSELVDPELKRLTDRMAKALELPRIRVHLYEVEPVNGASSSGRAHLPDPRILPEVPQRRDWPRRNWHRSLLTNSVMWRLATRAEE